MFDISGTIKKIFEEQTFGSGFNKREFVITTTADRYPQDIKFELVKDKVSLLEPLKEGDTIKVSGRGEPPSLRELWPVCLPPWAAEGSAEGEKPGGAVGFDRHDRQGQLGPCFAARLAAARSARSPGASPPHQGARPPDLGCTRSPGHE